MSSKAGAIQKIDRALSFAHDIRKFEIDLFWRRATYFWTLLAAVLVAFGVVMSAKAGDAESLSLPLKWFLLLGVALIGMCVAWALHLANEGSKFWQRNWEYHVDLLEDAITGPLYKTVISTAERHFGRTVPAAAYSVSKLANWLSLVFYALFVLLAGICLYQFLDAQRVIVLVDTFYYPLSRGSSVHGGPFWSAFIVTVLLTVAIQTLLCKLTKMGSSSEFEIAASESQHRVPLFISRRSPSAVK